MDIVMKRKFKVAQVETKACKVLNEKPEVAILINFSLSKISAGNGAPLYSRYYLNLFISLTCTSEV